jgi:putative membrane protein
MSSILVRWVVMTIAVLIAASIIPGFRIESPLTAFIAAVLLSLLNAFVRPILIVLTLPINILTLGLFILIINGLLIGLVAWLLPDLQLSGFGAAFLGALVISVVSTLLNLMVGGKPEKRDNKD